MHPAFVDQHTDQGYSDTLGGGPGAGSRRAIDPGRIAFVNNFTLVKTNSAKVFVILVYSVAALGVFIYEDVVHWGYGLVLAVGNSAGGWFGSRWQVDKGDQWIRIFLIVAVSIMAVKLWFF